MTELEYKAPEFKMIQCRGEDILTTSDVITPPWGGEEVTNPEFPDIGL